MAREQDSPLQNSTGDMAIIGDESGSGLPVSMQIIQSIYNELTGKSEKISQGYSKPYQITIEDLEQLNAKIIQLQEQYQICSHNCSVTVHYYKDTRETFSSFERFRLIDKSRLSPVSSVTLKYNFVIKLPKTNRLQNYNLSIRLASRITVIKELKEDIPEEIELPMFILDRNVQVSIEYVDYLVARNFQDAIRGWLDGLTDNRHPKSLQYIRRKAHYLPRITKYGIGGLVLWLILGKVNLFLPTSSTDLSNLAKLLLVALSLQFFTYNLASWLGEVSMVGLRNLHEISFLKINKGDEREIENALKESKYSKIKSVIGILGTMLMGVVTKILAGLFLR